MHKSEFGLQKFIVTMSQDIANHHTVLVVAQRKYFKYDFHLYDALLNLHIWTLFALFPIIVVLRKSSSKNSMTVNNVWEQAVPNRLKAVLLCLSPTPNPFRLSLTQMECIMACGMNSDLI